MVRVLPVLATLLAIAIAAVPLGAAPPDFSAVDEAARDAVASGEVPGAVILVGRGDQILYERAFGSRAVVPATEPMTVDTIFDLASLTKPLATTLAIMALMERGRVDLDAPVGRYLPEFRPKTLEPVTIRRLLTHSAGLGTMPSTQVVRSGPAAVVKALARERFAHTPGAAFHYSDTSFLLLGEVVRQVSGEPLDRYVDRLLVRPLRLADTGFRPPDAARPRIAPTEFAQGRLLRGEVHDPRARLLGGVAGHAGLFSTAGDIARISQMLLNGGTLDGHRVLRPETVRLMWSRAPDGNGTRTLGWDMVSRFAYVKAPFFPAESVGHLGFTGTSLWIDPASRTYLIILTNRVHPSGGGAARIRELRLRVTAAVGAALFAPSLPEAGVAVSEVSGAAGAPGDTRPPLPEAGRGVAGAIPAARASGDAEPPLRRTGDVAGASDARDSPTAAADVVKVGTSAPVRTGLDVLAEQGFAMLRGHTIGLVTNHTGVDRAGRRGVDLLAAAPGVKLAAIFSPEHGLSGTLETEVPHGRDTQTGRPIWSLYGATRRPDAAMLQGVTTLVFDIQDVGVRYYTYLATLIYVMEEAARRGIPVVVLDRPNPITGRTVEGPLMDPDLESFTAPHPIPVRTGMTIGEFARMAAAERGIPVTLTVVPLRGWDRGRWFDQTGLPWVNPSPNIRSVTQALLYSGIGLLEATNLSVGRGTPTPFEILGAPWLDADALVADLTARRIPGIRFEAVQFTPTADKYAQVACHGVRFVVTDRDALRPVTLAFALATALRARHRDQWRSEAVQHLLVHRPTMWAFLRGEPLERLLAWAEAGRATFLNRRASYLVY